MGIILQGFQMQGIPIRYSLPFLMLLALPFAIDALEPWEEPDSITPVDDVKHQYVQGEIGLLKLEDELEQELDDSHL